MHIVIVNLHIKQERVTEFIEATLENARNSIQEEGVVNFDFVQRNDDPTQFTLIEVYKSPEGQAKHRESRHYQVWKETVADMQAEPRVGVINHNLFPADTDWR
jgi:(4S)-4-hydroxy-5-phosphonooxypentane-2,3-dione isomerase